MDAQSSRRQRLRGLVWAIRSMSASEIPSFRIASKNASMPSG